MDEKTTESISSQRSSSLIRSKRRHVKRNTTDDILTAENQGIIIPRTLVENMGNKRVTTDDKDHCDIEHKSNFKNKTTSPFNTLAPTNPFHRENMIIVQYGELKDNTAKSVSDTPNSNELWGELPSTEVAESSKPTRVKGPKGGSKHPAAAKKSQHKPSAPPASPTNEKAPPPGTPNVTSHAPPQAHPHAPPQALPHAPPPATSGSSAPPELSGPHDLPPRSGQSPPPRSSPSSYSENGTCNFPECPARGPKQKERLCMGAECPVTLKKAVVKEAKKAMKRSCGKKRKNPLTILGAVLMNAFAGRDSSCKLSKEEKKALKRMKQAEEDDGGNNGTIVKPKKSVGMQCRAPLSQRNDRANRVPEKANKSTACDIPECPIAAQKTMIKEFMEKGQMCDIPSCPVKEPPPRKEKVKEKEKEKKVEPPKGCPAKPCSLKTKDEEFLKQLDPCIFEKLPRLKMTCDQALSAVKEGQSQPHHTQPAIKNKTKSPADETKVKEKGVKIVTAHVHVPRPSENPFRGDVPNPEGFPASNQQTGPRPKENHLNSGRESEYQKLVDQRLSAATHVSGVKLEEFESLRSRPFDLGQKETYVIKSKDRIRSRQQPRIRFSNVSVDQENPSKQKNPPEMNEAIESQSLSFLPKTSRSTKSVKMRSDEPLEIELKLSGNVDIISDHLSKIWLASKNGLITSHCQSSLLSTSTKDPDITDAISTQAFTDQPAKKSLPSISTIEITKSKTSTKPSEFFAEARPEVVNLEKTVQDVPAAEPHTLLSKVDLETRRSGSLTLDFSPAVEDKWPTVSDPFRFLAALPVKHSSAYNAISNPILEAPLDLQTPTEISEIKLIERNWKTAQNSKAAIIVPITTDSQRNSKPRSNCHECLSKTISETEHVAEVPREPNEAQCSTERYATTQSSREIQLKKPVTSLHLCQVISNNRKLHNYMVFCKNTSESFRKDQNTGMIHSIEHGASNAFSRNPTPMQQASKVSTAQISTQTLTTSAISPTELIAIGVGSSSMVNSESETLASTS